MFFLAKNVDDYKRAWSTIPQLVYRMGISGFPRGRITNKTIFPIGIARWSTWRSWFFPNFFFFSKIFLWCPKGILTPKKPTLGYQRKIFEKKNFFGKNRPHHVDQRPMPIGKMVLFIFLPLGNPEIPIRYTSWGIVDQALLILT